MHIAAGQAGRGSPGWSRTPPGPREGRWLLAFVLLGAVLTACVSVPEGPGSAPDARDRAFSAPAAWHHLQALTQIGTRQTGTRGSARARKYLRQRLEDLGANVEELTLRTLSEDDEASEATHLLATLPGESSDRFLLAASYDTRALPGIEFVGANASASGPALVLELARVLSQRPRAYTVVVALVDGDLLPAMRPGGRFPGSRSFASWLADGGDGGFAKIRFAVFFQQVADLDLSIARDLRSHPIYAGHLEFIDRGLLRTVVISDPRYGGSDVPGRYAGSDQDTVEHCSRDSLGIVGDVTLEALDRISAQLARIDRFHRSPLGAPPGTTGPTPARVADPAAAQVADDESALH
jgi:hypothetical protein